MMRCLPLALFAAGLLANGGPAEPTPRLTVKDNGHTVKMKIGAEFSLVLRQNITTGYSWQVVSSGDPVAKQIGEPASVPDSSLHGAGGMVTFRFRAAAEGTGQLKLVYVRPWEKETRPAESFAVTVVVAR